ncbi:hypothetical protein DPEC_G00352650 [Dallia pectoralis]|uniref:Uncharacterized protein n=1 Tax=Dallia pectoralis TaxID=75939 RepID=A0ACC2F2A3_DALPE|nr:hypothetical protein DPEC_G00352650 [Dallia pectoralis]
MPSSVSVLPIAPNTSGLGWTRTGDGKRKRKRSRNAKTVAPGSECNGSNERKAFQKPPALPTAPKTKILCRRPGKVSKTRNSVPSWAWGRDRGRWIEPEGHCPPLNPNQGPQLLGLGGPEETGLSRDHGNTSSLHSKATKHKTKARLGKLYVKGALLGKGGYGSVYMGTRKSDGMPVAIKYVSKAQAEEELDIMLEWFDQPSRYIMVLERPEPCQDLTAFCQDRGGTISEDLGRLVLEQLLRALNHCSQCGVLHRDVKPENLLIQTDSHHVKLLDFGCGDLLKDTAYKDFAGTLEYTPPEWFLQKQYLAMPATVWTVGITLYTLMCGFLPFITIRETIKGRVRFTKGLSPECRHLIRWCLSPKAADRPTLEQIQQHPWLI